MPFKSQAQRGWMYANHPEMAKRWEKHTPKGKLPHKVSEGEDDQQFVPDGYQLTKVGSAYRLLTPGGNEQSFSDIEKAIRYAAWHQEISDMSKTCPSCEEGNHQRCRDAWCDCCGTGKAEANQVLLPTVQEMFGIQVECDDPPAIEVPEVPKMNEVFVVEAPIQNRPPPGSQPLKPTEFSTMGSKGQALKKNLDAMKTAGQEMTPYKTPGGEQIAFPKDAAPGRGPVKADINTGAWTPMTGSAATGTPFSSQTPTTTMK